MESINITGTVVMTKELLYSYTGHLTLGFMVATVFQSLGIWMVLIAFMAGILKELYDKMKGRDIDMLDLLMTGAGGFLAWVVWIIYKIF